MTAYEVKLQDDRTFLLHPACRTVSVVKRFPELLTEIRKALHEQLSEEAVLGDDDLVSLLKEVVSRDFVPRDGWVSGVVLLAQDLIKERLKGKPKASL